MNTPKQILRTMADQSWEALQIAQDVLNNIWNLETKKKALSFLTIYDRYMDQNGASSDSRILEAIDALSHELWVPNVMSYESLILLNDLDANPFLFSSEYPEDEALFYQTHLDIEGLFFEVYGAITDFYQTRNSTGGLEWVTLKQKDIFRKLAKLMGQMKQESFNGIRPYWDLSNHHTKDGDGQSYPWPSGAYTCGFIYMDIALWVKATTLESYSMDDRMLPALSWNGYISTQEIQEIKSLVEEHWTLADILWDSHPEVNALLTNLLQFRKWHMQAARKFVWDENLKHPWTGWSANAKEFLSQHIDRTKEKIADKL